MAIIVMIYGQSGTGKSTSLRNFKPEDVCIVNVSGKPLPFKNKHKTFNTNDYMAISAAIEKAPAKSIVIDDATYLMTDEFMRTAKTTGYQKFTDMALNFYTLVKSAAKPPEGNKPDDRIVYFLGHSDTDANGNEKFKTIGKMLDLARQSIPAHRDVCDNHNWDKYAFMGHELRGATLGILGFGRIGQRVAHFAHAFDMNIVAYDPYLPVELFGKNNATRMETIPELLKVADYVTIHMPLNDETRNLFNAESISKMKSDAVVLNMARGGIVNEQDMYEALKAGKIGGYASDVMENELGGLTEGAGFDSPLFECDNFIVTPHLGAQSVDASYDIGQHIIAKVKEALNLQ